VALPALVSGIGVLTTAVTLGTFSLAMFAFKRIHTVVNIITQEGNGNGLIQAIFGW
jgi:hypothetical protein